MDLVGAVDEAERAPPGPEVGERRIPGEAGRAEHLNRAIKNARLQPPRYDLDCGNIHSRRFIARLVHEPGGAQDEKPGLIDLDAD